MLLNNLIDALEKKNMAPLEMLTTVFPYIDAFLAITPYQSKYCTLVASFWPMI